MQPQERLIQSHGHRRQSPRAGDKKFNWCLVTPMRQDLNFIRQSLLYHRVIRTDDTSRTKRSIGAPSSSLHARQFAYSYQLQA